MTVKELVDTLMSADPDAVVFLASDEEGNSYRKAYVSLHETAIDDEGEWVVAHKDDIENGEYEGWEDEMVPAIIFW